MSRRSPKPPSYLRHKARNLARVVIDGRTHYLGTYGSPESFRRYEQLLADWRKNQLVVLAAAELPPEDPRTVAELIARWWIEAERLYRRADGKPKRELQSHSYALRPLEVLFGKDALPSFGPKSLKRYRLALIQGWTDPIRGPQKPLGRKVINRHVVRVRTMFRWAESEEFVPANTFERLRTVPGLQRGDEGVRETKRVRSVREADVQAALSCLNPMVAAAVQTQLHTGGRPGEVLGLRIRDLQMRDRVEIEGVQLETRGLWVAVLDEHKTAHVGGGPRVLLFGPRLQTVLTPIIAGRDPNEYVFSPVRERSERFRRGREGRKTRVQPTQYNRAKPGPRRPPGQRYTTCSYRHAIAAALRRYNVALWEAGPQPPELVARHWHPHQLRHLFGSRLTREFGPEIARVLLGHADLKATRIYVDDDLDNAAGAISRVG
jgi:integrase